MRVSKWGVLSVQVLNEFAAVAHRKLGKGWTEIGPAIEDALALVDPPLPLTGALHAAALPRCISGSLAVFKRYGPVIADEQG